MITVKTSNLQVGDVLADDTWITEIHQDLEGTWIETSDGDAGYTTADQYRIHQR